MLVSDVIARVRSTAGDIAVLQFSDQDILNWINEGVRECAITNNLLQKRATSTTVVAQKDYTLPVDILKLHSIKFDSMKLPVLTLEEFDEQYPTADSQPERGTSYICYIWASTLTLFPAPDQALSLVIDYLYDPPLTTIDAITTTEVPLPVGYHRRIVDYCLAQVAEMDDDMQKYQMKMGEFMTGVQQLKDQPESTYDLYPSMSMDSRDMGDGWGDYLW